jgi:hypothetical protein
MRGSSSRKMMLERTLLAACLIFAVGFLGKTLAQGGGVQVAIDPTPKTVTAGDTFDLDVLVLAGSHPLDGAQIYIEFEPTVLQVVDVIPDLSAFHTIIAAPAWNNISGNISYASGILAGNAITGTFKIATLRFQAIAPTGAIAIIFDVVGPPLPVTKVTYAGQSFIPTTISGIVRVFPNPLTMTATPMSGTTITPTATPTAAPFSGYVRQNDRRCSDTLALPYYYLEDCQGQQNHVVFNVGLSRYLGQYVTIWGTLGMASICPGTPESGIIGYQIELPADPCVTPTPSITPTHTPTQTPPASRTPVAAATPTVTSTPTVPAGYGILQGRVTLQGRTGYSGALVRASSYSAVSATGGYFNLALPPGSYAVTITMNGYLPATCPAVAITAGVTISSAEVMLLSGDVDGDCDVDLFDLVAVAANFNQQPPAPPPYVDLNSDGQINILDVVMLASNYGRSCPSPWTCP